MSKHSVTVGMITKKTHSRHTFNYVNFGEGEAYALGHGFDICL